MIATGTLDERLSAFGAEIHAIRETLDRASGDDDPSLTPIVARVTRCAIGVAELEREILGKQDG